MTALGWAMDGALALALPLLVWRALAGDSLHETVVLFVAIGFLMAIAWARLAAPDVALVEAAVGAGLTGALLMSALGWVAPGAPQRPSAPRRAFPVLILGLSAMLVIVVLRLPDGDPGLRSHVLDRLGESGVSHPVTAVLLNFRGYDTLLEIAVLLAAAVAPAWGSGRRDPGVDVSPLIVALAGLLVPGILLVAGDLLWMGSHGPGGAFQAGAVLGGAGILLILAGSVPAPDLCSPWVRAALLVGPAVFLGVAVSSLLVGGPFLQYPQARAGGLIFAVETALTLSVAMTLAGFFAVVARLRPPGEDPPRREPP